MTEQDVFLTGRNVSDLAGLLRQNPDFWDEAEPEVKQMLTVLNDLMADMQRKAA